MTCEIGKRPGQHHMRETGLITRSDDGYIDHLSVRLRNVRKLRLDRAHSIRFQQHVVPVVDVTNFVHAVILPHSQPVAVVGIRHDVAGRMMDFHETVFAVPDVRCDVGTDRDALRQPPQQAAQHRDRESRKKLLTFPYEFVESRDNASRSLAAVFGWDIQRLLLNLFAKSPS